MSVSVCVQSILDVCSLVDARASPKEMLHPAAVLARRHPTRRASAHQDGALQPGPSQGRDVFMSNVEMVSFTFCVTNRKIGYKILRACAWARPRLECALFSVLSV